LQCPEAQSNESDANEVGRRFAHVLLHPGWIFDEANDSERRQDADRHIDEEHPTPGKIVGDPATERRPEDRRFHGGYCRDGKCGATTRRWKRVENDGLLIRLQSATE
jgi:hypothetical protein